jgi:hypothetical protein
VPGTSSLPEGGVVLADNACKWIFCHNQAGGDKNFFFFQKILLTFSVLSVIIQGTVCLFERNLRRQPDLAESIALFRLD